MDFQDRPPWRSTFIDEPHFDGAPVPSAYAGKTLEELLHVSAPVTKDLGPVNGSYKEIEGPLGELGSPELRRHPILDKFTADMGNNPIALANYVLNEIELTDAIAYNDSGDVGKASIQAGGVNRGALATFLEGQGSPIEQCALLVYLLRQANVHAVYVWPPKDAVDPQAVPGLKMLDYRMSRLLRMQLRGLVNHEGEATVPQILSVNYPWVAAYVNVNGVDKWVHIFPWLKDTEIKEGLNLYDYMPEEYNTGIKWLRKYLKRDSGIFGLPADNDGVHTLLPLFVKKQLHDNFPDISYDGLGMQIRDRRNDHARWEDFPQPWEVSEASGPMVVQTRLDSNPDIFDTVKLEFYGDYNGNMSQDPNEALLSTGDMYSVDLHNRRVLVRFTRAAVGGDYHRMSLSLAPFRPGLIGLGTFGNSDPRLKQESTFGEFFPLGPNAYNIRSRVTYKRQRSIVPADPHWDAITGYTGTSEVIQEGSLTKGDLAAICLNFGRVTKKMVQVHAEEFWAQESALEANPGAAGDPDVFQGTAAYIMGMSYYEKVARFQRELMNLHKVNVVSSFAHGFALLGARRDPDGKLVNGGEIDLVYPMLDMNFKFLAYAGNGTARPDLGNAVINSHVDFNALSGGAASAQEHLSINSYFNQADAVSTVKLLHQAWADNQADPGIYPPPAEVNKNNYVSVGNTLYTYNGNQKTVQEWAGTTTMWPKIAEGFALNATWRDYQVAIITQRPQRAGQGGANPYHGMAAFVIYPDGAGAYISPNINGGSGAPVPDSSFANGNFWKFSLTMDDDFTPRLSLGVPTVNASVSAPDISAAWNYSRNYDLIANSVAVVSGTLSTAWNEMASLLGSAAASLADKYRFTIDTGYSGKPSYFGNMLGAVGTAVGDPVNIITGEFYIDAVDVHLNGPMPLSIRRNYTSQNVADNEFGYGWKMAYFPYLVMGTDAAGGLAGADLILAAEMDGSVIAYRQHAVDEWKPTREDNPNLCNMSGDSMGSTGNLFNARITKTGDLYYLHGPDGSLRTFRMKTFVANAQVDRGRPYIESWQDNRGNSYLFTFFGDNGEAPASAGYGHMSRIQSSNGNYVGFNYDIFGHIIEAYTGDGRRLYYDYDEFGDLVQVTLPDATTIAYDYEHGTQTVNGVAGVPYSKHLIIRETKPGGRVLENDYDAKARVITQRATVGQDLVPVQNASFNYNDALLVTNPDKTTNGVTIVKDAYDRPATYHYTNSQITRLEDAEHQVITQAWYAVGEPNGYPRSLKQRVDRRGLITDFEYDGNGNLVKSTLAGNLAGGNANNDTATTTYRYNALNLIAEVIDPAGNWTRTIYDPAYTYLPATIERHVAPAPPVLGGAGGALIGSTHFEYESIPPAEAGAPAAYGVLWRETRGYTFPNPAVTTFVHNAHGLITSTTRQTGTPSPDVTMSFAYNLRGELIEQKDAQNRAIRYAYDGRGHRIWQEWREDGSLIGWHYDYYNGNGEIEWSDGSRYNPEDYTWRKYDGAGRLTEQLVWRSEANPDGTTGVEAPRGDALYASTFQKFNYFGDLTDIIDPRQNWTHMEYDDIGRLKVRKFYHGNTNGTLKAKEEFTYEPGDQIATYTNPLNGVTRHYYTSTGRIKRKENPDGTILEWRYYPDGRISRDPVNHNTYWSITYNDATRTVTRTLTTVIGGATLASTSKTFDPRGNVVSETDAENANWTTEYDGLDRVKNRTGPPTVVGRSERQTLAYNYDNCGKVTTVTNGRNDHTITTTDILGRLRLVEVTPEVGAAVRTTAYGYSADHHSVTVTTGTGASAITSTTFSDNQGRPVLSVFGGGVKQTAVYDANGNLTSSTDEKLRVTTFSYDALNRLENQTLPDTAELSFKYDNAGNLTDRVMPGGITWHATYDNANRQVTERLMSAVQLPADVSRESFYAYYFDGKEKGKLYTVTDGRGITHTTTYDAFLRPSTMASAGGAQAGVTQSFVYDNEDRVTQVYQTYANAANGPPTTIMRSYDAYGQMYDETVSIDGVGHSQMGQTWDAAGRRKTLDAAEAAPANPLFDYGYRADGLLSRVTSNGQDYGFSYGDNGLLAERSSPYRVQNITTPAGGYGRDSRGRITDQKSTVGATVVLTENQEWWDDSTLKTYGVVRNAAGTWNESRGYTYNDRGQLLSESFAPKASTTATLNYQFDGNTAGIGVRTLARVGNTGAPAAWQSNATDVNALARVEEDTTNSRPRPFTATGKALGAASVDFTLDGIRKTGATFPGWKDAVGAWTLPLRLGVGEHTLLATAQHPSGHFTANETRVFTVNAAAETITSDYDGDGNVTSRVWSGGGQSQVLTWDAAGRLIKVVQRDGANNGFDWIAVYDGLGRRLLTSQRKVANNLPVGTALEIASYYDPLVEFLEIGVAVNGAKAWKVYGPDLDGVYGSLQGTGGLEAIISEAAGTVGIINDAFGNTVASVSGATATWNRTPVGGYGPIPGGEALLLDGTYTLAEVTAWRSHRLDPTGLYYLGARYYDPGSGRFISADPLGHGASLTLYDYADGDPVNGFDPDGRVASKYANKQIGRAEGIGSFAWDTIASLPALAYHSNPATIPEKVGAVWNFAQNPYGAVQSSVGNVASSLKSTWSTIQTEWNSGSRGQGRIEGYATAFVASFFVGVGETRLAAAAERAAIPPPLPTIVESRGMARAWRGSESGAVINPFVRSADKLQIAQVLKNRAAGNAFRDEIADAFRQIGLEVDTEVYKRTPFGKRFIDIEVTREGRLLGGIETKVGSSRYTTLQRLKDWWLKLSDGYTVTVARKP